MSVPMPARMSAPMPMPMRMSMPMPMFADVMPAACPGHGTGGAQDGFGVERRLVVDQMRAQPAQQVVRPREIACRNDHPDLRIAPGKKGKRLSEQILRPEPMA